MQSQSPITSTTGNRFSLFSITTAGQWYGVRIRQAAKRAGFTDTGTHICMKEGTEGPLIVMMFPVHSEFSVPVKRLRFERGSDGEIGMGTRLVAALQRMAEDLDGVVCDPTGAKLSLAELQAAGDALDEEIVQRIKATEAAEVQRIDASQPKPPPVPVRQPSGNLRTPGLLSFTHTDRTARGKLIGENLFHSEPLGYYEGRREGFRRAAEMLTFIKERGTTPLRTEQIIAAAFGGKAPGITFNKSADNVAGGFIEMIVVMVQGAARHIDHEGHIERAIAQSLKDEAWMAELERDRHHKTAVKAAATRAARRAGKSVAA